MGKTSYRLISAVVAMLITVNCFAQTAQSDHFNIIVNNPTVLDVRANDGYAAGTYMTIPFQNDSEVTFFPPQHGSIVFLNNYTIFYTPDSGFVGHDEFVYGIAFADKIYFAIDTARVYINVIAQDSALCQASFVFNANPVNNQVAFQGSNLYPISGNPTSYLWTFSDNTTSTTANPIHYFPNGKGQACLTIQTAFGCSNTMCDSILIAGNNCEADFSYQQENCINCYYFNDNSQGTVQSWQWNFGENAESALQNPNHIFPDSGIYHVCLSVITSQNCQDTYCENIYVPYQPVIPEVCNSLFSFIHSPQSDCINCYNFSDSSSGNIISWDWQFGDGTGSSLQNPTHSYLIQGVYTVCLKVITADSCSSLYCSQIEASEQSSCIAIFSFLAAVNNIVNFNDNSIGEVVNWYWNFGDGTSSDIKNPQHSYTATGHYQVCLTITTASGCTNTYCKEVQTISHLGVNTWIGGLVYAGDQLLPDGIVILYDVENNYKAIDWDYIYGGFWTFPANSGGKYLVYAIPKYNYELTLNKMYLPTYYGNNLFWQSADTLNTTISSTNYDIQLQVANNLINYYGEGSIKGNVIYTCDSTYESDIYDTDWFGCDTINNISQLRSNWAHNMPVLLLNDNNIPVKFELSGNTGIFAFSNITNNMYKIHTEKAGLLTQPLSLTLNTQHPNFTDISIVIGSSEISSGINNFSRDDLLNDITLYPVPVKEVLHINVEVKLNEQIVVEIIDALGKIKCYETYNLNQGANLVNLNLEKLNKGLYFVKFTTEKGKIFTRKLTK